jgi:hypothetical protein
VAQPTQDMSEVSITYKTMGICLSRLRCGAIGWRIKLPIKIPPGPKLDALTVRGFSAGRNVHKHDGAVVEKMFHTSLERITVRRPNVTMNDRPSAEPKFDNPGEPCVELPVLKLDAESRTVTHSVSS